MMPPESGHQRVGRARARVRIWTAAPPELSHRLAAEHHVLPDLLHIGACCAAVIVLVKPVIVPTSV